MIASNDFLAAAAFAFEKRRGVPLGSYELSVIDDAGLADPDCERLADEIWSSLEEERPEEYRVTAYWALGKQYRTCDKKRLVSALRRELPRSTRAVFQILVALENCGEDAFDPTRNGRSIDEAELNRRDGGAYLARTK